ncbi:interferon-induced protein 44-like isoform X2 [Brienomyrus brachyistius]|uniref:interferon-induced protein 44-like isoform X2 n=1 Tax=Brienomyrus brachyistius TaxID=42636 RepID=UPI0020B35139|nr:interferon-induced protein 44-like isoform X2 [Brienomyrus brachyistius]
MDFGISRMTLQEEKRLVKLFPSRVSLCLLYQGSRHGFKIRTMREKTQSQESLIFLTYLESGTIMGGYLGRAFPDLNYVECSVQDKKAFVFSVSQKSSIHFPVVDHRQAFNVKLYEEILLFGECLKMEMKDDSCLVKADSDVVYNTNWPEITESCVDVEIHRVQDAGDLMLRPWREMSWTETENLRKDLASYKPDIAGLSQVRALLLGPVGSGKSSFINSIKSMLCRHVVNLPITGSGPDGFTSKLKSYPIRAEKGGQPIALTLCDVRGLGDTEETGLSLHDALAVIKGHAPEGYKFQSKAPLQPNSPGYRKDPALQDKIHCVLFVLDACRLHCYSKELKDTLKKLRWKSSDLGIPQLILLTHVELAGPSDMHNIYASHKLREKMEEAAEMVGVPLFSVLPVKNYASELNVDCNSDILLLSAVSQILHAVNYAFED